MKDGYVKLFRKFAEWKWYGDSPTKDVFIHCLLMANYQESQWKNATIPAGAFITSAEKMGIELGYSRQQIRRAFRNLQTTNELTIKTTNQYTLIIVENWAKYQIQEKKTTSKSTTEKSQPQPSNNQQRTTDKELKKERIKEEVLKDAVAADASTLAPKKVFMIPTLQDVADYCTERKNNVNAERWFNYYSSNGWMVGKNHMKDWKAAVRTWESETGNQGNNHQPLKKPDTKIDWLNNFIDTQIH